MIFNNKIHSIYRFISIFCIILISFFFFIYVIYNKNIENYIGKLAINCFNKKYNTKISVKSFRINYIGKIYLNEVKIKDHHHFNYINIKSVELHPDILFLLKNHFHAIKFKSIIINYPSFNLITYKNENINNFFKFISRFKNDNQNFISNLNTIKVLHGKCKITNQNILDTVLFNSKNINFNIKKLKINNKFLIFNLEKCCFDLIKKLKKYRLKQFSTFFYCSNNIIKFNNLVLETNSSLLLGNGYLLYQNFSDFLNFNKKVNISFNLKPNSILSGSDINYFFEKYKDNSSYKIHGILNGNLNNLKLTKFYLKNNKNEISSKYINIKNILNSKNYSFFFKNLNFKILSKDFINFFPNFLTKDFKKYLSIYRHINYKGTFYISSKLIITQGNLNSESGNLYLNFYIKNFLELNCSYKGIINMDNFMIEKLIKNLKFNKISGKINFIGNYFNLKNIKTKFNIKLSKIYINNHLIKNHIIRGFIKNQIFFFKLIINDPYLNSSINTTINFSQPIYKISTNAILNKIDISKYGFVFKTKQISIKEINIKINFKSIDNYSINLKLDNVILLSSNNYIKINHLVFNNFVNKNNNFLNLNSPTIGSITISGRYNLYNLSIFFLNQFKNVLFPYQNGNKDKNLVLNFNFELKNNFVNYLFEDILVNNINLNGQYNSRNEELNIFVSCQEIKYKNLFKHKKSINFINSDLYQNYYSYLNKFLLKRQSIYNFNININSNKNNIYIKTYFDLDNYINNQFNIKIYKIKYKDKIIFKLLSFLFKVNNNIWRINNNYINKSIIKYDIKNHNFIINNFIFQSENSKLRLSLIFNSINNIELKICFQEIELKKIFFRNKNNNSIFQGMLNGILNVKKINNNFVVKNHFFIKNFEIDSILFDNIESKFIWNNFDKKLFINTKIYNKLLNQNLIINGSIYNFLKNPFLNIKIKTLNFDLNILQPFFKNYISNIDGKINGNLIFYGNIKKLNYKGNLSINNLLFKINQLGVVYQIKKIKNLAIYSSMQNNNNLINFYIYPTCIITKDREKERTGLIFGIIQTFNFKKFFFNIDIESKNLIMFNTDSKSNDFFYGKVFTKGFFNIYGNSDEIIIDANIATLDGSKFFFNINSNSSINDTSKILTFKKNINLNKKNNISLHPTNRLSLDFKININEKTQINFILNDTTGEKITAYGRSFDQIRFKYSPTKEIKIDGKYEFKYGSKYFFKTLLNKEFLIKDGGTLIWSGDPYNVDINIVASQIKEVSNLGDFLQIKHIPIIPVELKILINNKLSNPNIIFKIDIPNKLQEIKKELNFRFNTNPNLEKNQFGILLFTGKFFTDNSIFPSGLQSSAYEIILQNLIDFINKINHKFQINLKIIESDLLSETIGKIVPELNFLILNRIQLKSILDIPFTSKFSSFNLENKIEWDISKNKNKTVIIHLFSQIKKINFKNLHKILNYLDTYGIGFLYKKSFNSFSEFLELK